jgi:hypothetical protein
MIAPDESSRKGLMRGKSAAHTSGRGGLLGYYWAVQDGVPGVRPILPGGNHSFVN